MIYTPTKKKIIKELYEKGKLDVGELRDLKDKNVTYDIVVFMYYKEPDKYGFKDMVILDYTYGASDYEDVEDTILFFAVEIYDTLVEKGLITEDRKYK